MFFRQRNRILLAGLLIGASACWSGFVVTRQLRGFVPFVAAPLPQLAIGDFDGDGRPDVASIDDRRGLPAQISVGLSGSADVIHLPTTVAALVDGDVDHDGDLDLLATTTAGDVLVWINDGQGRFTQRTPSQTHGITDQPVVAQSDGHPVITLTATTPLFAPENQADGVVHIGKARAPTDPLIVARHLLLLHSLRAPPPVLC